MRLAVDQLSGERGGETIFSDISFARETGQALLVTGPNGVGKSTLLRIVAGLLPSAEGTVALEGGEADWADVATASHYLGHQNGMKAALTVGENLSFWQRFLGHARLAADEALEMVGLGEIGHLPYGYLSAGQRRRVAIARLLVSHRPIWLLDEPTSGLDAGSVRQFSDLMQAHLDSGGIVIAATHLPLGIQGARELRMGEAARC